MSSLLFALSTQTLHPADSADFVPEIESSTAQQYSGSNDNFFAPNKYGSGDGFPFDNKGSSPWTFIKKRSSHGCGLVFILMEFELLLVIKAIGKLLL